ncbi:MAG: nickel pincer cofactor biosynthesis protein LarC [Nodosilinea sp.]
MKTIAYLDCPSGISGDMCLAAVIDAGVPLTYLQTQLQGLGLEGEFSLTAAPTQRQGQRALQVEVTLTNPVPQPGDHHHGTHQEFRNLPAIQRLLQRADLPDRARYWSLLVFQQLAEAEAAVHGIAVDQVHFHEVGAIDAIVDVVGTCLGFHYLGIDQLYCSALPTGQGRVKAAHGWLPVPAPAVLKLMQQRSMPIYSNGCQGELVTPTGAAIVAALAQGFGPTPAMTLERVGLGAGRQDLPIPNMVRLWLGTPGDRPVPQPLGSAPTHRAIAPVAGAEASQDAYPAIPLTDSLGPQPSGQSFTGEGEVTTVAVLETQVDDMLPQVITYLYEQLFAGGALDVFTQPLTMKKSRPGLLITVIAPITAETRCTEILLAETPTLGIRHQRQQRTILRRDIERLTTRHGVVAVKLGYHPQTGNLLNVHPEYEDCAALARQHHLPWQVIYDTALTTWWQSHPGGLTEPGVNILIPEVAHQDGANAGDQSNKHHND